MMPDERLPWAWRLGNALVAYVAYLGKLVYPVGLAVFYPHPQLTLPLWKIAAATLALLGVTAGVLAVRRQQPHLLVGWLWYLVMLVPVIGLVQVGAQGMADRYTYLPQIGLGVAVSWAGAAACRSAWVPGAAGAAVLLLAALAWHQAGYWRNSETLFTQALACTAGNYVVHNNLGLSLARRGQRTAAITQYRKSLEIKPDHAKARNNLGNSLAGDGQVDEVIAHYRKPWRSNRTLRRPTTTSVSP